MQNDPRVSTKTKAFILAIAALGLAQLVSCVANWHVSDSKRFVTYLVMAIVGSLFQMRRPSLGVSFSVNVPFVIISMVELSISEAMTVGCAAALAQCLCDPQTRRRPFQILLTIAALATVIASAGFVYSSLLPKPLESSTLRLLVAAGAFFVANTLPAAIILRLARNQRLGRIWKESFFWSFPYYVVAAAVAGVLHLAGNGVSLDSALLGVSVVYVAYRYYSSQKGNLEEKEKHAGEMAALHLRAIEGLALAVEAKDNLNTRGHLRRVQVYALEVGKELGLSGEELEALHAAALLHDIGKLAVPEHILTKPGKLTAEEFAKMKVHPVVGAEIVEQVKFPYPVAPIVRAHHEKWDGSGYPYGLKGEAIPLGARILSAVDCLDALSSDREYRRGLPLEEAMKQISAESGKSFDPVMVEILERRFRDLEGLAKSQLHQMPSLSTNAVIPNGHAPAAGLDLHGAVGMPGGKSIDFLSTIAAARREGRLLLDVANGLGSSLDMNETLERVEKSLRAMIPHNTLAVFIQRGNTLVADYVGGDNADLLMFLEVPAGEGLAGWVAQSSQPVVNGNPTVEPGFACHPSRPLRSALAVPLEGSQGTAGVMVLYHQDKEGFTRDHLRMLLALGPRIGQAVENALKYRATEERANTDRLTQLPNAYMVTRSLETELARARRVRQPLAVMVCALDGIDEVRRERGPAAAEQLLHTIAKGLKEDCREYDHLGTVAAGEFAFVLPGMKRDCLAAKVARLTEIAVDAQISTGIHVSFRTGEAFYPDDGESGRHLLSIAKRRLNQLADVRQLDRLQAECESPVAL